MDTNEKSPCFDCEHIRESKLTFPECVNCVKRFGKDAVKFLISKGYEHHNKCKWPHGCNGSTVRAEYCSSHCTLIAARRAYWKDKGLTPKQMDLKLFAPRGKVGRQFKNIRKRG